nr:cytosolic purine 5'-nucleotidase-like [Danio rerio]|eukprot:XP_021335181.1 cytosolic purine 5'-nucleotidase-like [Danio rerio]
MMKGVSSGAASTRETYLYACLVDFYTKSTRYKKHKKRNGAVVIADPCRVIRAQAHYSVVVIQETLKERTLKNQDKYVIKDPRIPVLLSRIKEVAKVFLATNSDFNYTEAIMKYLLDAATASSRGALTLTWWLWITI